MILSKEYMQSEFPLWYIFIFYNSEHKLVTCWIYEGYIAPPNKNCILIRHRGINHFNWIKHGISCQQPTKVVDSNVSGNDKYLPVNNKNVPLSIDNVINIETKKDVQILLVRSFEEWWQ